MTDCKGLFGKIFGHKFINFIVYFKPFGDLDLKNHTSEDIAIILEASAIKHYEIRCKRCGAKIRDDEE